MKERLVVFAVFLITLSSCSLFFPEDGNMVEVVPWRFIPEKDAKPPNYSWGRVPVPQEEAENYDVIVGWKKFEEIIGKGNASQEERVSLLGKFAIDQVVILGYCKEAEVPEGSMYILGWEGSGNRGINVTCKK